MGLFYEQDVRVNRNINDLLSELAATTISPLDRRNYGRNGEFRGDIWYNGFNLALNTFYRNSFASEATGIIQPVDQDKCVVHLKVGPRPFVLVFMCIWNFGLLMALIAVSKLLISGEFGGNYAVLLLFVPFIIADFVFLRFALYSNYKKLKARMLDLLSR